MMDKLRLWFEAVEKEEAKRKSEGPSNRTGNAWLALAIAFLLGLAFLATIFLLVHPR